MITEGFGRGFRITFSHTNFDSIYLIPGMNTEWAAGTAVKAVAEEVKNNAHLAIANSPKDHKRYYYNDGGYKFWTISSRPFTPPGYQTGRLSKSIGMASEGFLSYHVGTDLAYAKYHQVAEADKHGGSRPFLSIADRMSFGDGARGQIAFMAQQMQIYHEKNGRLLK